MAARFLRFILSFAACFVLSAQAQAYYGRNSTEANLTFTGRIELELPGVNDLTLDDLNSQTSATGKIVHGQVSDQVKYLMGFFLSKYLKDDLRFPFEGILGETWGVKFFRFVKREGATTWVADYQFNGKVVFRKAAFRSFSSREIPIILPLFPKKAYELSVKDGLSTCVNKEDADDDHEDFWYDWDLKHAHCTLRDDTRNLIRTTGNLEEIQNTTSTYPDYNRLYGNNFNGNTLQIASFFGYIGSNISSHHANRSDDAYKAMNDLSAHLRDLGYKQTYVLSNFRMYRDGRIVHDGANIIRVFEKPDVLAGGRHISVRVQILFADSDTDTKDVTFVRYFEQALASADVIHYDGHSGLGAYLAIDRFHVQWNPEKYQTIFFNGCSTYPYFNGAFISAKGGKNLNVLTSGTPTLTSASAPNALAFLDPFLQGHLTSWQHILGAIESSNGDDGTSLTGVSGDETNAWHP